MTRTITVDLRDLEDFLAARYASVAVYPVNEDGLRQITAETDAGRPRVTVVARDTDGSVAGFVDRDDVLSEYFALRGQRAAA
jgi:ABC-type sugar transport system substrate-binding protein